MKWAEEREASDNDDSDDDDHDHVHDCAWSRANRRSSWMKMGVIESGDSGKDVATRDTSGTESDDSAEDVNTSALMEANPLLEEEGQTERVGCVSCKEKCTLQNVKLYVVRKFKSGLTKLKKAATVLRDRRVFLSITLYMMLSFSAMVGQEVSIQQRKHAYISVLLLN